MKLSWSHKLFFKINGQIGKRPRLDSLMAFFAKWLIFVSFIIFILYGISVFKLDNLSEMKRLAFYGEAFKFLLIGVIVTFLGNWTIGLIVRKRRPIVEFSDTKVLIKTLGTWKSFPSDHATIAFLFPFVYLYPFILDTERMLLAIIFLVIALFVSISRVYVGVHYPRDVVGAAALSFLYAFISYKLVYILGSYLPSITSLFL